MKKCPFHIAFLIVLSIGHFAFALDAKGTDQKSPALCDVKNFGAKGDGATKDTAAIQAAIDSCAIRGGIVDLHDGTFLSGMITLKSNVVLRVETSATLKGTQDDSDYPDTHPATNNSQLSNCRKTLIYAENANHIGIEGGGTIDGSGKNPNWRGKETTRPMAIFIVLSSDVTIQNINVVDAGMWGVVNFETDHVVIRKLNVHSPYGPTRDGIDIVDCHHVLIEDSTIFSEDDSICLKSGSPKGVYDVIVRNSHVLQSSVANGLKLGTASVGSFKKVLFENIAIDKVDKAAMAVESVDGADIDDITFKNIKFKKAGTSVFLLLGRRGQRANIGSIQNITFKDIQGTTFHTWGSAISGTVIDGVRYAPKNLLFSNVQIESLGVLTSRPSDPPEYLGQYPDPNLWGDLPAFGYYFRHVDGVTLHQCTTVAGQAGEVREPLVQKDVTHFSSN
ncbi:MAG: glycoside hydrolase family 28 protein [Bacteriovorax sp.]